MGSPSHGPPQLGADSVVRFLDADHFLHELSENMKLGRLFVRTKRTFATQSVVELAIEVPGIEWKLDIVGVVLLSRNGYLGLELQSFDSEVWPALEQMSKELKGGRADRTEDRPAVVLPQAKVRVRPIPREEATVIGPAPQPPAERSDASYVHGEAAIEMEDAGEEERTRVTHEDQISRDQLFGDSSSVLTTGGVDLHVDGDASDVYARGEAPEHGELDVATPRVEGVAVRRGATDASGKFHSDKTMDLAYPPLPPARVLRHDDHHDRAASEMTFDDGVPQDEPTSDGTHREVDALLSAPPPPPPPPPPSPPSAETVKAERAEVSRLGLRRPPQAVAPSPPPLEPRASPPAPPPAPAPQPPAAPALTGRDAPTESPQPPEPPAPPPGPSIRAAGLEALASDSMPLARVTKSGVMRVAKPEQLLGRYLSEIVHGRLITYGGPDGDVGAQVSLRIASSRVAMVSAKIVARLGDFVALEIADASPVAELLRDSFDGWQDALRPLLPPGMRIGAAQAEPADLHAADQDSPAQAIVPPAPAESASSVPPPKAATRSSIPPPPSEPAPIPMPSVASVPPAPEPAAAPPPPPPPPKVEETGPPEPPKLEGDVVSFRGFRDLAHELKTNLKNGGLFVVSPPIEIRAHRSLKVSVAGQPTGVNLEADVVFAASGRVGFSVGSFAEAVKTLEALVGEAAKAPIMSIAPAPAASIAPPAPIVSGGTIPPSMPAPRPSVPPGELGGGGEVGGFSAKIGKQASLTELLDLPARRIEDHKDVETMSILLLLDYVARKSLRGVLSLKKKDESKAIYFHDGGVVFIEARPWVEEHSLGRVLIHSKKISESALREGLERSRAAKRPLGRMLVSLGHVTAAALTQALRDQIRMKVEPVFDWSQGTFEWLTWREPPTKADLVTVNAAGMIARYLRHRWEHSTTDEIEALFQRSLPRVVISLEDPSVRGPSLGLGQKELRFIETMLDGRRSMLEAVTGSPLGRLASMRLVGFGLSIGMLKFKDGGVAAIETPSHRRDRAEGTQRVAFRKQIEEQVRLLRQQNYFEIIGVHWSAHYRTYRAAYEKAKARFDANKIPLSKELGPDVGELLKEAGRMIDHAYKMLMNEEERIRYRKKLFDATEREYSADMLVKQAEIMIMRGDRMGGIEAFETAVELAPTNRNKEMLAKAREGKQH